MKYNKKVRLSQNVTQTELALKLNISHQAISKWETGKCFPDIITAFKIAKILNCTIDELFIKEN